MEQQAQRRLAAVLAADVAGYTRLMQIDETGTMDTWWTYRREIVDPVVGEYSGRIVKHTGDGFLAEFASATNAVLAAYDIQRHIESRVIEQPEDRRMQFRIGVNLGDILWDDEDIYGDDVNVAARLEGMASPGSILISQSVYDRVKRNAQLTFESQGEIRLKNIADPIHAYRVIGEQSHHSCISGIPDSDPAHEPPPRLPNSLAVLPFAVFGNDTEQEYFADGFTEDLITELSRFNELFVTSRNASFAFKGRHVDPRRIGRELGVSYCLEGSVRKMGEQIRLTCQLINTSSGNHVWANKYDRALSDLFEVQDELAEAIVVAVAGRLEHESLVAAKKKLPADMYAYDCLLRGLEHHRLGGVTRDDAEQAARWFRLAVEKDPQYGRAHAWLACAISTLDEWSGEDHWDECVALGQRALELDDNEAESHRIVGTIALYVRDYEKSEYHFQRALELNPNNVYIVGRLGALYLYLGDAEKALEYQNRARALDPLLPTYCRELEAAAYYSLGNYRQTVSVVSQLLHKSLRAHAYRVAAMRHLDDARALQQARDELLIAHPDFSINRFLGIEFYRDKAIVKRLRADLDKAGLPRHDPR